MNSSLNRVLKSIVWLLTTGCFLSISGSMLLNITEYNIYRVLDLSAIDLTLVFAILFVQYLLLRYTPIHFKVVWQESQALQRVYFFVGALVLSIGLPILFTSYLSFWVFPISLGVLLVYAGFINRFVGKFIQQLTYLVLFGAAFNSSQIFLIHEKANENRHFEYARQLIEPRDTFAESQIAQLLEAPPSSDNPSNFSYWEKRWIDNSYLSSNYYLRHHKTILDSNAIFNQPILNFSSSSNPSYWVQFSDFQSISFELKKSNRRSIYADNIPFKKLENLNDYRYNAIKDGEVILSNTHDFDLTLVNIDLPPVGAKRKIKREDYDAGIYRHSENEFVIIGEPLSELQIWISNFAFFFSLLLVITLFRKLFKLLIFNRNLLDNWQSLSLQNRIQTVLAAITCFIFLVIALSTFIFLHQNNSISAHDRLLYMAEAIRSELLEKSEEQKWRFEDFSVDMLSELADRHLCDIDLYNKEGKLMSSSFATANNSPAPSSFTPLTIAATSSNPTSIIVLREKKGDDAFLRAHLGIFHNKALKGFVGINAFESEAGTAKDILAIMSKLLNVYVFLFITTWGTGLLLINLLNEPLKLLIDRLSRFKLGKKNKKLEWHGNDAIGKLISEYNHMVDKLEGMTEELVKNEREAAWQIMAKQIAHDINNSLTPLRLNTQFLSRLFEAKEAFDLNRAKQISSGLLERIDALSAIATQFRLFANLEKPDAKPLEIKRFLDRFFSQHIKRSDYQFDLDLQHDSPIYVHIDAQHLNEVLKNILFNAEEDILEKENGTIFCRLNKKFGEAIIEIKDNGNIMDTSVVENIFDPNFSTITTQSGLSLPICKRIVEFYGGRLKFSTSMDEGNRFQIYFPLFESQNKAKPELYSNQN